MKPIEEVTACVVDYGSFISLAECLAEQCKKVYYYSPFEEEYRDIRDCCIGDGLPNVERLNDYLDPEAVDEIDLFAFPDIGFGGHQRLLKKLGKAVWGSMGASDLELYRTRFLKVLESLGLPVVPSEVVHGLAALMAHLKDKKDKWIKVNHYRGNMETWHHLDWEHSQPMFRKLAHEFGGLSEYAIFVVQDPIETDIEIGYDGWIIDGEYPPFSFQGYEKKNELYLGSLLPAEELPDGVKEVNTAMAPFLAGYGYRNFWATEIREVDGVPNFIDPTARLAGQTMEHQFETCENLPEVIWHGAHGEVIEPKFRSKCVAEATMHYTAEGDGWKVLRIPDEARPAVKLYQFCQADGLYHFPPHAVDEVGVICGEGDTVEAAIEDLKENFELLESEPLEIRLDGFACLIDSIKAAKAEGIKFTDGPLPRPEIVLD